MVLLLKMVDNFIIKKTNYLSILENNISRAGLFVKWIRLLNEGSICHYALTHNVQLNSGLLKQVFTYGKRANHGEVSGFKLWLPNRSVFITKTDLNTALHLSTDNFVEYPSNEELLGFFTWKQCTLDENNMVPRVLYQNHILKEWHFFHNKQPCLRSKNQWIPRHLPNDSDHWICYRPQPMNQLWTLDYAGDNKESTICEGKLLSLSKIPPDGSRTSADRGTTRYVCQRQDDRTSSSFTEACNGIT